MEHYLKKELYDLIKTDDSIFEFIQDGALDGLWYWDLTDQEEEWLSPKFWQTLGYDPATKKHKATEWQSIIHPNDLGRVKENLKRHLKDARVPFDQVVRFKHRKGKAIWIRCRGMAIRDSEGKPIRMIGAHTNVTRIKQVQQDLKRLKNEFETVFNGTQDAMFLVRVEGYKDFTIVRTNKAHQEKTGITLSMIAGKSPYDLLGDVAGDAVASHYQNCVDAKVSITYEETLALPLGTRIWQTTLTPIINENKVTFIVGSASDITKAKHLEEELEKKANYDTLTSLMNRSHLYEKITTYIRDYSEEFTLFFIDLDEFKPVNDNYGHKAGDIVLKTIAKRIMNLLSENDCAARLGGDEFMIVVKSLNTKEAIEVFTEKLKNSLLKPIHYNNNEINVGASIGHASYPDDGDDFDALFQQSDKAMYAMKNTTKSRR